MGSRLCAAVTSLWLAALVASNPATAATIRVAVDKISFSPAQVSAHVGDTIEWVNSDFLAHSATDRKKAWDIFLPPNAKRSMKLTKAGEIDYYCRFHPNMAGHISVAP
ncbi:MAG TPA: cupredoxin domain-containing protein [Xanthobacteraceae bacterium]|jgi:plastocyanin